ncbi:MAG: hypothetical protein IH874_03890 [Candidatus Dadabacteria bacterium]|nr:hypothetical protein [Candidatus Dadabacteria bacterium]
MAAGNLFESANNKQNSCAWDDFKCTEQGAIEHLLAMVINAVTTTTGAITAAVPLAAVMNAVTTTTGAAKAYRLLRTVMNAVTTTAGAISLVGIALTMVINAVTTTAGKIGGTFTFKMAISAVTTTAGKIGGTFVFKAVMNAVTSTTGVITVGLILKALMQAVFQTTGILTPKAFNYKWSLIDTDAETTSDIKKLYVEIDSSTMPGAFPTGAFFERRIMELPTFEKTQTDPLFGISGFGSTSLVVSNADKLFNVVDLQGAFAKVWVVHENVTEEFAGVITAKKLHWKTVIQIEDMEAKVFEGTLPHRTVNDTTFPNAEGLGKRVPIIFGRAKKVPLININVDDTNRDYDFLIGEGTGLSSGNFNTVYTAYREDSALDEITGTAQTGSATTITLENADRRPDGWYKWFWAEITGGTGSGQIRHITDYISSTNIATVDSAWGTNPDATSVYRLREWRFYDGSQGSPHAGYAFLRFKKRLGERTRFDNLFADVRGLTTEENVVRAIESILTNTTWGLGLIIDTASFDTAAALAAITAMKCEGAILTESGIFDILNELLMFRGMTLSRSTDIGITVDSTKTSAVNFGLGDGLYENIISIDGLEDAPLTELAKDVETHFQTDYKSGDMNQKITRTSHAKGTDVILSLPFVHIHETADRIADYQRKRLQSFAKTLRITVGLDAEPVNKGDSVTVDIPSLAIQGDWEVIEASRGLASYSLTLMEYIANTYTYEATGGLPSDPGNIPADFSLTNPDPVSNLAATMAFSNDESTAALTWDLPATNAKEGVVFKKLNSAPTSSWEEVGVGISSFTVDLIAGLVYDFMVLTRNEPSLFSGAFDPGSIVVNKLALGDTSAPATPGTPTLEIKFRTFTAKVVGYTKPADFKTFEYQRTTSGGSDVDDPIFDESEETSWTEDGTTTVSRKVKVRAIDNSGNPSAFSSLSSTKTTAGLVQDDIIQGEVTVSNSAVIASINPLPAVGSNLITVTMLTRGFPVDIEFSMNARRYSPGASGIVFMSLIRDTTTIQQEFVNHFLVQGEVQQIAAVFRDTGANFNFHTWKVIMGGGNANTAGGEIIIKVTEKRR